jgi:glycosidase
VYYGSEWGIEGEQHFGDHELRPALEEPEWNELTDWIGALAKARHASEALRWGDYTQLCVSPRQLAFQRRTDHERVIVLVNAADEPAVLHFDAQCGRGVDLISGAEHDFGAGSELGPFEVRFVRCER